MQYTQLATAGVDVCQAGNSLQGQWGLDGAELFWSLADSIPHMVWRADHQGQITFCNHQWSLYTGLSRQESVGSLWQNAFHSHDLKLLVHAWKKARSEDCSFEHECRIRSMTGQERWFWIKAVPVREVSAATTVAWVGTCTDIQERKNAELKMVEAKQAAQMAIQAKSNFLANMSHEIRTPLSAILGFSELLMDPKSSEQEKMENFSVVRRNGQNLIRIIDEILDISKLENGQLETEINDTDLRDLLLKTRQSAALGAEAKGLQFQFEIQGRIPNRIRTDGARIQQILSNLISNAIKFTDFGEIRVAVRFSKGRGKSGGLHFEVHDTGTGISPLAAKKLFTPFLQADASSTRRHGGTGLGLAYAKKISQALGGDAWLVESSLGLGSTFAFNVPIEICEGSILFANLDSVRSLGRRNQVFDTEQALKGIKILLVDDVEDNQILIQHFLAREGAEIEMASNGSEGVEKALSTNYHLVLMDIQMPVLDGYEATTRLRRAGYRRPIIALTAHALKDEREKCLRVGCDGHLTKPINRKLLIQKIQRLSVQETSWFQLA